MYSVANLEHYALVEWQGSGETGGNAHLIHMVTAKVGKIQIIQGTQEMSVTL